MLRFVTLDRFSPDERNWAWEAIDTRVLPDWGFRLRPFLLPNEIRSTYRRLAKDDAVFRLGDVARLGIGYVTGANDFFHLTPSRADSLRIPARFLRPAVRTNRDLRTDDVSEKVVADWIAEDRPVLLLDLNGVQDPPASVVSYLESPEAAAAKASYKCRNRSPWYRVPDVQVPDAFLSIMSSRGPRLVGNSSGCVCTNSVHAVHLTNGLDVPSLVSAWKHPLTMMSCELEGHSLGGGMLKVEPKEARRILVSTRRDFGDTHTEQLEVGRKLLSAWRHVDGEDTSS